MVDLVLEGILGKVDRVILLLIPFEEDLWIESTCLVALKSS